MAKNRETAALKKSKELEEKTSDNPEEESSTTESEVIKDTSSEEIVDIEDQLNQVRLELDEYKNLYLRKAAEFENFKKRKQRDFQSLIKSAGEALITDILPILDDFDRFLATENSNNESFLEGARLIREKLWESLAARGLQPIPAVGNPFDPEIHEAIMEQKEEGSEPGLVLQEHQCGYRLGDKVIRHAKVIVSA